MKIKASRSLKIVYCLVLLGSFFIVWHMASSSWIGLATGLAFRGGLHLQMARLAIFLIFGLRIVSVIFDPKALDVYATGIISKAVRILGIFLMGVGFASIVAMFFIKPITLAIFHAAGDGGIGYFAVGFYLVYISPTGIAGVLVFEMVRLWGTFIRKIRINAPASETSSPEEIEKRKISLLEKLSIALVILATIVPLVMGQKQRLIRSVFFGENTERIKTLVKYGCDVNKRTISGYSLLHHAASRGDKELVEILISKGANVNTKDQWGGTPLHCISQGFHNKNEEARDTRLYKEGLLGLECKFGTKDEESKLRVAEVLISHGADVNKAMSDGMTPLHMAAYFNKLQIAKMLIRHGANVNFAAGRWGTPLHNAGLMGDYVDMAKLLIENGANVNIQNDIGYTPLHTASERGNKEVVKFLLSIVDTNVNAQDKWGGTPIHRAAGHVDRHDLDNKEVVEILLANGADINARNEYGATPLHNAAAYGSPGTVETLLAHHADVNARSKGGSTPLHSAAGSRESNINNIELLIKYGALVNQKNERNKTALDEANYYGYKEKANLLLLHGANQSEAFSQ